MVATIGSLAELQNAFNLAAHWIDTERPEHQAALNAKIRQLMEKHGITRRDWFKNVWFLAVIGYAHLTSGMGFPRGRAWLDENGEVKPEEIIDESVDVNNPVVINYLRQLQENRTKKPPQPQPLKDNPRKLDWRPVLEWKKRHPSITHEQIAKMLDYKPGTVRRKLAEIDTDIDNK